MKKTLRFVKWVIVVVWFGVPFLLKAYGTMIISEPFDVMWAGCGVFFAIIAFGRVQFLLFNHLKTYYPQEYKRISEYRSQTYRETVRRRNIEKRYDMAYSFSPPNDEHYTDMKRTHKETFIFSIITVILSFLAFWNYGAG